MSGKDRKIREDFCKSFNHTNPPPPTLPPCSEGDADFVLHLCDPAHKIAICNVNARQVTTASVSSCGISIFRASNEFYGSLCGMRYKKKGIRI